MGGKGRRVPGRPDRGTGRLATVIPQDSRQERPTAADLRTPVIWGAVWGCLQAASPLALFWLDPAVVYALGLALIAAVYIGFAVADGRPRIIAVEITVASAFVGVAAAAVTGSAWLIVAGLAGHGLKDLWQERTHF